jgi:hypothetical protein
MHELLKPLMQAHCAVVSYDIWPVFTFARAKAAQTFSKDLDGNGCSNFIRGG